MTRLKPNFSLKHWRQLKSKTLVFEGRVTDRKRHSLEEKKQVVKYLETHSVIDTAEHFGIRESLVANWKKDRINIDDSTNQKRTYTIYSDKKKAETLEYLKIHGINKTAGFTNVALSTIVKWARKEGIKYPTSSYTDETRKAAVEYSKTHDLEATCKKFCVVKRTLKSWRQKFGSSGET